MQIIGHQKQWQFLKQSAELQRLSHAYLFSGPEKLGKKTLALEWASFLMGENLINPAPFASERCGIKRQHPDLILITPENSEIKISQIRNLIWKLSLKPYSAPLKVAILDEAHLMNRDSQNCFLKTLEEPKAKTLLILITEYPETLLPTILSRCQIIKFQPVAHKEIENYLRKEGVENGKIQEILKISLGKPGRVVDFLSNSQKLEDWKGAIKEIIKISDSNLAIKFQYAKTLAKRNNKREILEIWLTFFRNILISKIDRNYSGVTNLSQAQKLTQYSFARLRQILEKIQNTNFLITKTNVNPRLSLEILMLAL